MVAQVHGDALLGRATESAALRQMLTDVRHHGSVLVLHGEPGVGKTALIDAAASQARWLGLDVLHAVGVQAEAEIPLATLHQLTHALRNEIDELPGPQRLALRTAFGEVDGPVPDLFLVGLAVLTLLSGRATTAGLLIVIDDLQWVDDASRKVLTFVARRLQDEPIVLAFLTRSESLAEDFIALAPGSQVMSIEALGPEDSETLLAAQPDAPSGAAARRVLALALGNPLALIELSRASALPPTRDGVEIPLTHRLERAFAERIRSLSDEQRALVLVAAVHSESDPGVLISAAERLVGSAISRGAFEPVLRSGLMIRTNGRLHFRHPLMRSAALQLATTDEVDRVHRAVAELLPPGTSRQLWHLAVVAHEPDETLAAALEKGAARQRQAGDLATAVAAFARAAELSPISGERARRTYLAAETALVAGRQYESRTLAEEVTRLTDDRALLTRVAYLRSLLPGSAMRGSDPRTAIRIADELFEAGNREHAAAALARMALQHWSQQAEGPIWDDMIGRLRAYGLPESDSRLLWMRAFGTPGAASADVRRATDHIDPQRLDDPDQLRLLGLARGMAGSLDGVDAILERSIALLRQRGRLSDLPFALTTIIGTYNFAGRFAEADSAADEARSYASDLNDPISSLTTETFSLITRANLGDDVDVTVLRTRYPALAGALQVNPMRMWIVLARGIAHAAHGRHGAAADLLGQLVRLDSPHRHWGWGEREGFLAFADAAARSGRPSELAEPLERIRSRSGLAESPLSSSIITFGEAMIASPDEAEAALRRACDPQHNILPFWRARAELAYGELLRRDRRILEAREHLRSARNEFTRMASNRWAESARAELAAAGEESPRLRPSPRTALTPQEERIALLAAGSMSNRDIAERLFLSPRTVSAHLYSAYRKLEISSRAQLGAALQAREREYHRVE